MTSSKRSHPMTIVLLVRHGTTATTGKVLPGRLGGLHLSEKGKGEAQTVAERICELDRKPCAVYASPLERTKETANSISRALGVRTRVDRALLEPDVGSWAGQEIKSVAKDPRWEMLQRNPARFRFPEGESIAELSARMNDAVSSLVSRHAGETIVVVSHADTIKVAVANAAGAPLDLFQRFMIAPCSVSALAFVKCVPSVLCVNSTGSLADLRLS
ncbi:MAG: histidine phosphatase family protein [Acidimicrobiales bacterium]